MDPDPFCICTAITAATLKLELSPLSPEHMPGCCAPMLPLLVLVMGMRDSSMRETAMVFVVTGDPAADRGLAAQRGCPSRWGLGLGAWAHYAR
jgi:hypothetical protein